jgi:putative ABC transport system permease protein
MSACLIIFLWVHDELSYDGFHDNADHIYRVVFADESYDQIQHYSVTPPALAVALQKDFPEIQRAAKFYSRDELLVSYQEKKYKHRIAFTDASAADIFTFSFIKGDAASFLANPSSLIITERMADKYFGPEDPINKIVTLENERDFIITGVIKNLPTNSTLQFDFLTSFENLYKLTGRGKSDSWDNFGYHTFVLLPPGTDITALNQKIAGYAINAHSYGNFKPKLYLQRLQHIHLYNLNGGGGIVYIYIFSLIALFVLIIACINFINLTTARTSIRAKEIGLRKVIGARRSNLIFQFYGESILISFISLLLCLVVVERVLPVFNTLSGKNLSFDITTNSTLLPLLFGITLVTGILSGSYPALVLSSLEPVTVLKGLLRKGTSLFRNLLVVFQFSLSIALIICTLVIANQLNYMKNKDLGFCREQLLYIPLNEQLASVLPAVKNEIRKNPRIEQITAVSSKIGIQQYHSVDLNEWEGNNREQSLLIGLIYADYDFCETFDVKMASGRFFSREFTTDSSGVILNETAIKEMGVLNPIGKHIFDTGHILGIIKNFNFQPLYNEIKPLALILNPDYYTYLAIKIKSDNLQETLDFIKGITGKFAPDFPFEYQFLDEEFNAVYRSEQQTGTLFTYFALLTIFISCLGLFGLASFTIGKRTKEISIRKVLGASVFGIIMMLSKDFTKWVLLANVIAWPLAFYAMSNWLQNYAYRIKLSWYLFVLAGFMALIIALLTVSSHAVKAALSNPAHILRSE